MLVRPVQPENASLPIVVTEMGITVFIHPAMSAECGVERKNGRMVYGYST